MKDAEYFDRIEPLRTKLYRMAYPYFNSESMAIDAVDEAIYKGYLKKKQIRKEEFFETWMIRILLNIPQGTVATRLKKALELLRIDLVEEESYE